jgi:hypothetical protein
MGLSQTIPHLSFLNRNLYHSTIPIPSFFIYILSHFFSEIKKNLAAYGLNRQLQQGVS